MHHHLIYYAKAPLQKIGNSTGSQDTSVTFT